MCCARSRYHRGMKLFVLAGVGLVAACAPPAAKPAAKPEPPTLDVEEPWSDPTAGVPQRARRPTRDRAAALHNADAPAIALRHATILTANGQTIADGTIV